jgi:hypothetical protein
MMHGLSIGRSPAQMPVAQVVAADGNFDRLKWITQVQCAGV